MSDELAQAANTALETYQELARHAARCQQCRIDPSFCDTRKQHTENFGRDYRRWEQLHELADVIIIRRGGGATYATYPNTTRR